MNYLNPIVWNSLIVVITTALSQSLTTDEQALVGSFLSTLGDMLSFNSTYLSYIQQNIEDNFQQESSSDNTDDDQYDILKKSIDKIQEELEKLKKDKE